MSGLRQSIVFDVGITTIDCFRCPDFNNPLFFILEWYEWAMIIDSVWWSITKWSIKRTSHTMLNTLMETNPRSPTGLVPGQPTVGKYGLCKMLLKQLGGLDNHWEYSMNMMQIFNKHHTRACVVASLVQLCTWWPAKSNITPTRQNKSFMIMQGHTWNKDARVNGAKIQRWMLQWVLITRAQIGWCR